ncbi:hypothetical protein SynBIOSE41_01559 [Synechococcus sp. BIOS-E4-1]|nr:hypothetical protein SynBIOSE41_01559 [Synechococcus sp. BIOS-E4-1]
MFSIQRLTDKGWQTKQRGLFLDEARVRVRILSAQCEGAYRVIDLDSLEMQCLWKDGQLLVDQSEPDDPPVHPVIHSASFSSAGG